jgi:hypothetical protein
VRGGALPLLAFAALLTILLTINWIWTDDAIQVGTFAFAVMVMLTIAAALTISRRDAARRGPPPPADAPQTVPAASLASVSAGVGAASIAFGAAFGRFLVYFGAGLLIASLGRIAVEARAERRSRVDEDRRR